MKTAALSLLAALATFAGPVEREAMVDMDDGVALNTTVCLPDSAADSQRLPAIVFVHGFGASKTSGAACRAATRGYVGMAYTVRGQGRRPGASPSQGLATPVGEREAEDLRAMLAWLKQNHPVDPQKIGVTGVSQGGHHSWMAVARDMGVAAAVPANFTANISSAVLINGGIHSRAIIPPRPPLEYLPETIRQRRADVIAYDSEAMARGTKPRDLRDGLAGKTVPVMALFAFEDGWGPANNVLDDFRELRGPKKLYLGTGGHGSPNVAAEARFRQEWTDRWFDRWLKGERNGIEDEPTVEVALMGSWRHMSLSSFPPPEVRMTPYYLEGTHRKGGSLAREESFERDRERAFTRQTLAHRATGEATLAEFYDSGGRGILDRFAVDSLRYATPRLDEPLLLVGMPQVQLALTGTARKRQVAVRLWDVDPSGARRLISRMSTTRDRDPSEEWNVSRVVMSAAAYEVPAGHVVELEVSNLDLGWDAAEQNWGRLWAIPVFEPGEVILNTGERLLSLIRLPVLPKS